MYLVTLKMCAKRGITLWTYRLAGRWIQRPGRGAGAPGRTESSGTLKTGPTIGSWNVDLFLSLFRGFTLSYNFEIKTFV